MNTTSNFRSSALVRALALRVAVLFAIAAFLAIVVATIPGCNTVHGVGKDISNASTDIEDSVFGSGKSHTGSSARRR